MSVSFFSKIRGLTAADWLTLVEIPFLWLSAVIAVRFFPLKKLQLLFEKSPSVQSSLDSAALTDRLQRLSIAFFRRLPFEAGCLEKSLAFLILLKQHGLPADLKIGLKKEHETLKAHAWIEQDGKILFDDPSFCREYAAASLPSFLK